MHYYKFNISDWASSTSHLTLEEEGVYLRLINHYYDKEEPIPKNPEKIRLVLRRLRLTNNEDTFNLILNEFFIEKEDGWHHNHCQKLVDEYKRRAITAKENGQKGGRPKKTKDNNELQKTKKVKKRNPEKIESVINEKPDGLKKETQKKPILVNHKLLTTNHKLLTRLKDINVSVESFDDWLTFRKKNKANNTDVAIGMLVKRLEEIDQEDDLSAQQAVDIAISNGWKSANVKWVRNQNGNNQSWRSSERAGGGYLQQLQKISENITES